VAAALLLPVAVGGLSNNLVTLQAGAERAPDGGVELASQAMVT
jgi:hypothetical protein